ncbi:LPS export ABC transporter periplasmic protein LptC [Thalassotalea sp. G2M2-11]|uniref:LPS export ABC transporter periplasmic protein LptC n=1 Tax=Thalassotalea sp. G2M2-11 TaxID=2787627 RepID=UPI0019D0C32B|nr:LPS export ABC transporter periplasmic protein LptC [Thalassotalea sp. G2M2-11]
MSKTNALTLAFFIISVITYAFIEWRQANVEDEHFIDQQVNPDFIAEALNSEIFKANGQLSYQINADRMEHYAELAVTHFEFPKYTLYPKDSESPWKISANEGTLYNNNRVKLANRVSLISLDDKSLIQEINGKHLELDLKTNIISSVEKIEIRGKDFSMLGSGLIVDLNTKQVTLTNHEKTIYQQIQE